MIAAITIATAILAVLLMSLAMVGRSADWSPFALVISGAIVGIAWSAGFAILALRDLEDPRP